MLHLCSFSISWPLTFKDLVAEFFLLEKKYFLVFLVCIFVHKTSSQYFLYSLSSFICNNITAFNRYIKHCVISIHPNINIQTLVLVTPFTNFLCVWPVDADIPDVSQISFSVSCCCSPKTGQTDRATQSHLHNQGASNNTDLYKWPRRNAATQMNVNKHVMVLKCSCRWRLAQ